jgi:hypothetical protein
VHDRAEQAVLGDDATLASFARQFLDPSVRRTPKPPTTFS